MLPFLSYCACKVGHHRHPHMHTHTRMIRKVMIRIETKNVSVLINNSSRNEINGRLTGFADSRMQGTNDGPPLDLGP